MAQCKLQLHLCLREVFYVCNVRTLSQCHIEEGAISVPDILQSKSSAVKLYKLKINLLHVPSHPLFSILLPIWWPGHSLAISDFENFPSENSKKRAFSILD